MQRVFSLAATPEGGAILDHLRSQAGSLTDGGPLVYLIETPEGSIFFQDSSGCWTGVMRDLSADVAILAAAGRPNVDGEPNQGSMAQFLAMEAKALGARTVVIGHHDDWMPPVTSADFDMKAVRKQLASDVPGASLLAPAYLEPVRLL
jgi:L-ascorbate metabolism protein UlaG (beta-lactamase superfamily)